MENLEQKIKCIIETLYKCCYTRGLSVEKHGTLYVLKLFLHDPNFGALVIANQCNSDEDFLKYVEKELKDRKLTRSQQYKLIIYGNNTGEEGF